jgi:hypothetical protein
MFVFSPHALADVVSYHATRGLHCESLLGFALATVRCVTGTTAAPLLSFGSDNLRGPGADVLAAICGPASVVASVGLGWWILRGSDDDAARQDGTARLACAAFASLVVLWLTAKVFSPQYMTWGIPVVLAIPGALGIRLAWLLLGAMALTQFYVCGHYELVRDGRALGLLNLGARHAVLVVAGVVAARSLGARARSSRSAVNEPALRPSCPADVKPATPELR